MSGKMNLHLSISLPLNPEPSESFENFIKLHGNPLNQPCYFQFYDGEHPLSKILRLKFSTFYDNINKRKICDFGIETPIELLSEEYENLVLKFISNFNLLQRIPSDLCEINANFTFKENGQYVLSVDFNVFDLDTYNVFKNLLLYGKVEKKRFK